MMELILTTLAAADRIARLVDVPVRTAAVGLAVGAMASASPSSASKEDVVGLTVTTEDAQDQIVALAPTAATEHVLGHAAIQGPVLDRIVWTGPV